MQAARAGWQLVTGNNHHCAAASVHRIVPGFGSPSLGECAKGKHCSREGLRMWPWQEPGKDRAPAVGWGEWLQRW